MKFRKKPVIVEATQLEHPATAPFGVQVGENGEMWVITIHGQKTPVVVGDWIITEPDGWHHYPCKPEIFAASYEPA